jgi:prepilin-type N-terminal cleavage/methylation domain-containing protein
MNRVRDAHSFAQLGFTLVELLVALTITLLVAGALAATAPAARAAFDRVPSELEMQQRGRVVIDVLTQALRAAERVSLGDLDEDGRSAELTVVTPIVNPAQGILSIDQAVPGGSMTLGVTACPSVKDLCGFVKGTVAIVTDGSGDYDVFIVASVDAAMRRITPADVLSRAYPAGSRVIEVEQNSFGLDEQADGSFALVRTTAAGAVQPIADAVLSLAFTVEGDRVDAQLTMRAATDDGARVASERVFRTSVEVRNRHAS